VTAADPFMAGVRPTGLQRGRGGFIRNAWDTPYVTDPSGELVKSGERKGEIKRIAYGQPSGAGRLIENESALTKWKQRLSFLGIGMSDELREQCKDLSLLDSESDEFKTAADLIAVEADKLTRSWLAADRGSHGHLLCELQDKTVAPTDEEYAAGEALGLKRHTQTNVIVAWGQMLADNGLKILAIEASCVDDQWRLAGTLDRIVRCTRPLRFIKADGEIVDIPVGTVLVLDIKFGQTRRAHLVQVASYAQSVPYDTETETRGAWPWPISQDHALIAHGDFGDDLLPPSFELVWVDLVAGREHGGQTVARAKEWSTRADLWSVAQVEVEGNEMGVPVLSTIAGEGVGDTAPSPAPNPDVARDRNLLAIDPDQGADLSHAEYELLWAKIRHEYDALPAAERAWVNEISSEATRRNLSFHTRRVQTERSYHIAKALITLATAGADDAIARELLAQVIGDVAFSPHVTVGWLVGSLDVTQAVSFSHIADTWAFMPALV
jgi:hypothetical protein